MKSGRAGIGSAAAVAWIAVWSAVIYLYVREVLGFGEKPIDLYTPGADRGADLAQQFHFALAGAAWVAGVAPAVAVILYLLWKRR